MKFVLAYRTRQGSDAQANLASAQAAQKLLANWAPHRPAGIQQWVQRVDGSGGYAVIETDDAHGLLGDMATWAPWLTFEIVPVVDIGEASGIEQDAQSRAAAAFG